MGLKFYDNQITRLSINGADQRSLSYNGFGCFGKCFSLSQNTSVGVSFDITRNSSPYQGAAVEKISIGNTIYYGDVINISVNSLSGYSSPKLFVDIGDGQGLVLRDLSFNFIVTDNVMFYGEADTLSERTWHTLFPGVKTDTWTGYFEIPGLDNYDIIEVTVSAVFEDCYIDPVTEDRYDGQQFSDRIEHSRLPITLRGYNSSIYITKNGTRLEYEFRDGWDESKGFVLYEMPISITVTEIRGWG